MNDVTGRYVVSLDIRSYANPTGRCVGCDGDTPTDPGCCDVESPVPQDQSCPLSISTCDTRVRYCLRPVRSTGICPDDQQIRTQGFFLNAREITFDSTFFGFVNPVPIISNESWQVSLDNQQSKL